MLLRATGTYRATKIFVKESGYEKDNGLEPVCLGEIAVVTVKPEMCGLPAGLHGSMLLSLKITRSTPEAVTAAWTAVVNC